MSLIGIATSAAAANATTKVDCFYQVTAAGNGATTYLLTGSPTGAVLTPNGTVTAGQTYDLLESATPDTGADGDSLLPSFPRNHTWYPVTSASGTVLMDEVPNSCSIDSGTQ